MTVKDLREKLRTMDDNYTITMQMPDGMQRDITKTTLQGDHFTFMTDSTS